MRKAKRTFTPYELGKFASGHGAPDEALRYIKTFAPGYLYMPLDQAPLEFWRLAFPFPFRAAIEHYSANKVLIRSWWPR